MWCVNYRALAMVLAMLFLLFSFWGATRFLVINLSHSMPVGIYWKQLPLAIHRGDQVLVCLPLSLSKSAYQAGIIHKSSLCGHGYQPLLKQVIATPTDTVTQDQDCITVNDKIYLAPLKHNRLSLPQGDIKTDGFWLYGAGDYKNSWDSRYFGARPIQEIHSVLRAIWIKDNNSEVIHV